jgi:peptidoglycan/xylan/chitin deacetylase (PgdA/CDA1 family)
MTEFRAGAKRFIRAHSSVIGSVLAVATPEPLIVLTYDDGPEPGSTEGVLDALAAHGATATFFVLMGRVRRFPALLAEVVAAGHEIALHGEDHRALTAFSGRDVTTRTSAAKSELEDLIGAEVRWVRPPYGRQSPSTWLALRRADVQPVLWGPTTLDSRNIAQHERVDRALVGAVPGAILLAHDGYAGPEDGVDDGPRPTVDRRELTTLVLDSYAERGLRGCSLDNALAHGTLKRGAWFSR